MAITLTALASVLIGVLALYVIKALLTQKKLSDRLPPGPKPTPIVGNISDLPPPGAQDWMHWLKHKELYGMIRFVRLFHVRRFLMFLIIGPISSITVMGQTIVIVNSLEIATELLNKRSAIYSSRPNLVFASEMFVTSPVQHTL